jgi:hypothetical protein
MTTMFKHFNSDEVPSANTPRSFPIAPTMQAIIVDRVTVANPQLASIIRDDAESIIPRSEKSHTTSPTSGKVITSRKMRPSSICVPVVHYTSPTSHVRPSATQTRASTTLAEVERIQPVNTITIHSAVATKAFGARDSPSISCVGSTVPKQHTSRTTTFEKFHSHNMPPTVKTSARLPIAPTMQTIVVNSVPIVDPQFATIIRYDSELILA